MIHWMGLLLVYMEHTFKGLTGDVKCRTHQSWWNVVPNSPSGCQLSQHLKGNPSQRSKLKASKLWLWRLVNKKKGEATYSDHFEVFHLSNTPSVSMFRGVLGKLLKPIKDVNSYEIGEL